MFCFAPHKSVSAADSKWISVASVFAALSSDPFDLAPDNHHHLKLGFSHNRREDGSDEEEPLQ